MLAIETIITWMRLAVEYGVSGEVLQQAATIRDAMVAWREANGVKLPD